MNLEYLKYEFKELTRITLFTWHEIDYAYNQKIISRKDIVSFAINELEENMLGYDKVLELAIIEEYEEISSLLHVLVEIEPKQELEAIKKKWLYVFLADLFEKREDYENALSVVEQLYADFDYPEEIASFVRYMPSEIAHKCSTEENIKILYENWKKYLNKYSDLAT